MTDKPLIVMALESEGNGQLEQLGFEVLYCGVGKVNATYHLTRRLCQPTAQKFSYVLNLGSAGSSIFKTGSLVAANQFIQRDMDVTGLGFKIGDTPFDGELPMISFPRRFIHLQHGKCGSGDSFLIGAPLIESDIIDMEAYALAKVCLRELHQFVSVKYITDGADHNASNDWQTNLKLASQAFVELLTSVQ